MNLTCTDIAAAQTSLPPHEERVGSELERGAPGKLNTSSPVPSPPAFVGKRGGSIPFASSPKIAL